MKKISYLLLLLILLLGLTSCKEVPTEPPVIVPPTPSVDISADPPSVAYSGNSVVTWSSSGATSWIATDGTNSWSGVKTTPSGTFHTGPLTKTTTFSITCIGSGGSATKSTTVTVSAAPAPVVTLIAIPDSIVVGQSTNLIWSSINTTTCLSINFNTNGTTSGSIKINPIVLGNNIYTIVGIGLDGAKDTTSFTVVVLPQILALGNFYQGGIIISVEDSLVITTEIPRNNWENYKKNCYDLVLNGYEDWFPVDISQLKLVWERRSLLNLVPSSFWDQIYWSSTLPPGPDSVYWAQIVNFERGPSPDAISVGLQTDIHNGVAGRKITKK